jgi:putative Ca2+/H+ antiporter (TMEM165/GDT1 family)
LSGTWFQYIIAASFIAMAAWTLIQDEKAETNKDHALANAFIATLIAFFLIEMGDKTQVATVALAARFQSVFVVAAGTTTRMLLADVPAVLLAERATNFVPLRYVRVGAALLFFVLGLWQLVAIRIG